MTTDRLDTPTAETMLSTSDNPFNPFTHFSEWHVWDTTHGYNSTAYLARVVVYSDELPKSLIDLDIERAIDEIVEMNLSGVHIKVKRPSDE